VEPHVAGQKAGEQTPPLKPGSTKLKGKMPQKRRAAQAAGLRATIFGDAVRFSNNECGFGKLFAMSKSQSRNFFTLGMTR
jgi:hypothetical protein